MASKGGARGSSTLCGVDDCTVVIAVGASDVSKVAAILGWFYEWILSRCREVCLVEKKRRGMQKRVSLVVKWHRLQGHRHLHSQLWYWKQDLKRDCQLSPLILRTFFLDIARPSLVLSQPCCGCVFFMLIDRGVGLLCCLFCGGM